MENEPLILGSDVLFQLASFVALFLAVGAVGFRLAVLRTIEAREAPDAQPAADAHLRAALNAAALGLGGAMLGIVLIASRLPAMAAKRHVTIGEMVNGDPLIATQLALAAAAVLGFGLVISRRPWGWWLAAAGAILGPLRALFFGQWPRVINPVHMVAGGLWIGTLLVMLMAGFPAVLGARASSEWRGRTIAAMVAAFSPLALGSAGVLATFGVITALRHLTPFASLWTTPYGYALIAKLAMVGVVLALGAWNWRRQRPRLGSEAGARAIQRSALGELGVAGVVLVITAILVSLPSPKRPEPPAGAPASAEAGKLPAR